MKDENLKSLMNALSRELEEVERSSFTERGRYNQRDRDRYLAELKTTWKWIRMAILKEEAWEQ
jgi:hypothetical protein